MEQERMFPIEENQHLKFQQFSFSPWKRNQNISVSHPCVGGQWWLWSLVTDRRSLFPQCALPSTQIRSALPYSQEHKSVKDSVHGLSKCQFGSLSSQ